MKKITFEAPLVRERIRGGVKRIRISVPKRFWGRLKGVNRAIVTLEKGYD